MKRQDFLEIVERHQRQVFTLARYLLSNRLDAEDVTQEVMVRLWQNGGGVESSRVKAWLLRVTRNASYDRLRRQRSAARLFADGLERGAAFRATTSLPDPEALAGAAEFRTRLGSALADLREPAKSILILREIQGLSYREIADVLELPLTTVKVTLHRGRRQLREELREGYHHVAAI